MIRHPRYARKRRANPKLLQTYWGQFLAQQSTKWLGQEVQNNVTVYDATGEDITSLLLLEPGPVAFEASGTFPPELTVGVSYFLFTIGTDNYTIHLNAKDGQSGDNPVALATYDPVTQGLTVGRNMNPQGLIDMLARGVSAEGMRDNAVGSLDDVFG